MLVPFSFLQKQSLNVIKGFRLTCENVQEANSEPGRIPEKIILIKFENIKNILVTVQDKHGKIRSFWTKQVPSMGKEMGITGADDLENACLAYIC